MGFIAIIHVTIFYKEIFIYINNASIFYLLSLNSQVFAIEINLRDTNSFPS